ncbi:methylamine utilization protein MauJ [Hyphomicrobium sp.]|uniref:methylamine utilization protein MauJ n=1 Tax=Hyphomicrobium sp. TaxID=82 RepID=UPI002E377833|nr:methylamine utilization protein MauJ [Hyphomicrobium sp.]HEX2841579.1 methylamine utilization protein MauJ [Hyphomicrobium sp.]
MWIPHNLLAPLKAETPKPTILASEAATEERTFVVGFFLRNPVTRAWETDVLVSQVTASREVRLDGKPCAVDECANLAGKLEEIIYTFSSTSATAALASSFRDVTGDLDRKALQYGRGFEICGWRVADIAHGARWRCIPFRPSALIAEPASEDVPQAYRKMLRLYREARSAPSAMWRLLSAGAILNAAVDGIAPFASDSRFGEHVITMDMLVRSGTLISYSSLKGATARDLRDIAEPARRMLLAMLAPSGETADLDGGDYHAEGALAALANLVDLVARDLLLSALRADGFLVAPDANEPVTVDA